MVFKQDGEDGGKNIKLKDYSSTFNKVANNIVDNDDYDTQF